MKAIMMSIRPEWVAKILNKEKTIEIRKRFPKDYVGWVYIYCTKDKKYANLINRGGFLTGMVVARFWCDKVEEIKADLRESVYFGTHLLGEPVLLKESCLSYNELNDYLKGKNGYAIYITKLEIFDKPKEISEFGRYYLCEYALTPFMHKEFVPLTRAPQSWCYIEI